MAKVLITVGEAIEIVNNMFDWDPVKHGKNLYSKKTFTNMIYEGHLHKGGPFKPVLLDRDEVIKVFSAKKTKRKTG